MSTLHFINQDDFADTLALSKTLLHDSNDRGLRLEVDGHPLRFGSQTAGQVRSSTPAVVVAIPGEGFQSGSQIIEIVQCCTSSGVCDGWYTLSRSLALPCKCHG